MRKLFHEIRHFKLDDDALTAPHEEIAERAIELAKGGHIVSLTLPDGVITVHPDDKHDDVVAKVSEALKTPATKSAVKGKSHAE
jgi:hypothetical protein